jgi:hypothetical protein
MVLAESVVTLPIPRMRDYRKQYIRLLACGKYQARPYLKGVRYNLGLFLSWREAHHAVLAFFSHNLKPRPKYVRPVHHGRGRSLVYFVVCIPKSKRPKKCPSLNLKFPTADDAAQHVPKKLLKEIRNP